MKKYFLSSSSSSSVPSGILISRERIRVQEKKEKGDHKVATPSVESWPYAHFKPRLSSIPTTTPWSPLLGIVLHCKSVTRTPLWPPSRRIAVSPSSLHRNPSSRVSVRCCSSSPPKSKPKPHWEHCPSRLLRRRAQLCRFRALLATVPKQRSTIRVTRSDPTYLQFHKWSSTCG